MAMSFGKFGEVFTSICNVVIRGCSALENLVGSADNLTAVLELETDLTRQEAFRENQAKRLEGEAKLAELEASFKKPTPPPQP